MKTKATKTADLEALQQSFQATDAAFLVEFAGLKVVDVDDLRNKVRDATGTYSVVKNTLARLASKGTALEPLAESFKGPTAVVTGGDDAPGVAKILAEFAKINEAISVKAGVVDGMLLDARGCKEIADIPSREDLLTKLAFLCQSPLQRLASVLSAPSRGLAVALAQVAEKQEGS
jgi:large subunit ribosomal protein L10